VKWVRRPLAGGDLEQADQPVRREDRDDDEDEPIDGETMIGCAAGPSRRDRGPSAGHEQGDGRGDGKETEEHMDVFHDRTRSG